MSNAVFRRSVDLAGHLHSFQPRTCWSLDFAPNLATHSGREGRTNVIICVDDFSKFVLLDSLPTLQSQCVANWIESHIILHYGKPLQIRTDPGPEFCGMVEVLCDKYAITHITTNPETPWQNGRAERMVRTTKTLIRRLLVEDDTLEWPQLLPQL